MQSVVTREIQAEPRRSALARQSLGTRGQCFVTHQIWEANWRFDTARKRRLARLPQSSVDAARAATLGVA